MVEPKSLIRGPVVSMQERYIGRRDEWFLVSSHPQLLLVYCQQVDYRVLFIIFILTASALRSRETPRITFPISFVFVAGRGISCVFRLKTRLPEGHTHLVRVQENTWLGESSELSIYSVHIVGIALLVRATRVRGRLPPE